MGIGTVNDVDTGCPGSCADVPCGDAPVTCLSTDDEVITAPSFIYVTPKFYLCTVSDDYPEHIDGGTIPWSPPTEGEDGCWDFLTTEYMDAADLDLINDNSYIDVLNDKPLGMEFVEMSVGAKCCTFKYETPVLDEPPEHWTWVATLGEYQVRPITEFDNVGEQRLQYIAAHPLGKQTFGPIILCFGSPCRTATSRPGFTAGYDSLWANSRMELTLCKTDCDGSWYGHAKVEFKYYEFRNYPVWESDPETGEYVGGSLLDVYVGSGGVYGGGPTITSGPESIFTRFHIPNKPPYSNAEGDLEFDRTPVTHELPVIRFHLAMQGGNPCPPDEVTKIPTLAYVSGTDEYGDPASYALLSRGAGNLNPLRIVVVDNTVNAHSTVTELNYVDDPLSGYEGYLIAIYIPVVEDVTTIQDALDLLEADDRFVVSDIEGADQPILPLGGTPPEDPNYYIIGQGSTSGGSYGTVITGQELHAEMLAAVAGTEFYVYEPDPENKSNSELFTPWVELIGAPGDNVSHSGCDTDEGCSGISFGCVPAVYTNEVHDIVSHNACYYGLTWSIS